MWLFTPDVAVSIVQKDCRSERLCVRARCAEDLDILRDTYLPSLSKTVKNKGTDYPFRAYANREAIAQAAAQAVRDITYANFKNEVRRRRGADREHVMHRVWAACLEMEPKRQTFMPRGYGTYDRPLWDDPIDDWNDPWAADDLYGSCPICGERVPVPTDEVDVNLPDDELFEAIERVSRGLGRDCEFNDTGSHWGYSLSDLSSVG
jgi:hypothetical protein